LDFRASYGFIYLRSRPLSPATEAFMKEIRAQERVLVDHEAKLEAQFRSASKQASV
jgi:hypothetical protein